ncbi:MAG TPA: hypothetical protein PLO37_17595 [Candidatus Hydrogenedentes bacterium]|nr:hypothetical protein [Candidatus Hydrogenedentota bacterium]HPG68663.1 hypothetical protein [Candidatus Hydrogenedentota bacterium]
MDLLPTVPFGGKAVTRLIIGGNPFRGNSHFSSEMDEDMRGYYTVARIKETLFAAERCGINTLQVRGDVLMLQCVREYWDEGGAMQFIVQTASELRDLRQHVKHLAAFGALGVYVHGTFTDRHFLEGNMAEVRDLAKSIRDTGVCAGLGTHIPEVIDLAEAEGWDLDFYMACLYNLSIRPRESALVAGAHQEREHFDHQDKWKMLERVRATDKTCLAFKVLGASRLCGSPEQVREAVATILGAIKPKDAMVVGMFTKYRDQIGENCRFVREILDAV